MTVIRSFLFLAYKWFWTLFLLQLIFNLKYYFSCFFLLLFLCFLFLDQTLWVWVNDGENISSHHYNKKNMKHGQSLTKSSWYVALSEFIDMISIKIFGLHIWIDKSWLLIIFYCLFLISFAFLSNKSAKNDSNLISSISCI